MGVRWDHLETERRPVLESTDPGLTLVLVILLLTLAGALFAGLGVAG